MPVVASMNSLRLEYPRRLLMLTHTEMGCESTSVRLHNPPRVMVGRQPARPYFVSVFVASFVASWPGRSVAVTVMRTVVPVGTACVAVREASGARCVFTQSARRTLPAHQLTEPARSNSCKNCAKASNSVLSCTVCASKSRCPVSPDRTARSMCPTINCTPACSAAAMIR